jgi:hypothetical protein
MEYKTAGIHFHNNVIMKSVSLRNLRTAKLSGGEKNLKNSKELKALLIHSSESEDEETVF